MSYIIPLIPAEAAGESPQSGLIRLAVLALIFFILICVFLPRPPHGPRNYPND